MIGPDCPRTDHQELDMRTSITTSLALALALSACGASQEPETTTTPATEQPAAEPTPAQTEPAPTAASEATPPSESSAPQTKGGEASPGVSPTPQMNDGQIAAFLAAANKAEIDSSELVKKSKNAEVKKLAAEMIKDHKAADKKGTALCAKASITPEASGDDVQTLQSKAQAAIDELRGKKGADLDKAYVDAQVKMHQEVIEAVDQKLLPAAQNADLKSFINEIRPKLQAHLDHAKAVQEKLGAAK
jgi:putative membrane protein